MENYSEPYLGFFQRFTLHDEEYLVVERPAQLNNIPLSLRHFPVWVFHRGPVGTDYEPSSWVYRYDDAQQKYVSDTEPLNLFNSLASITVDGCREWARRFEAEVFEAQYELHDHSNEFYFRVRPHTPGWYLLSASIYCTKFVPTHVVLSPIDLDSIPDPHYGDTALVAYFTRTPDTKEPFYRVVVWDPIANLWVSEGQEGPVSDLVPFFQLMCLDWEKYGTFSWDDFAALPRPKMEVTHA